MWTYLKYNSDGEWLPGEKEKLPPGGTAYLAFDSLRWKVVLGYTERGGYSSILSPNVCDDCNIIAFAPLSETTDPDEAKIRASCPWSERSYADDDGVTLMRNEPEAALPSAWLAALVRTWSERGQHCKDASITLKREGKYKVSNIMWAEGATFLECATQLEKQSAANHVTKSI